MATIREKDNYGIGIVCALAIEKAAMVAMLDETHPKLLKDKADPNDYTFGRIGKHDVVIACLPAGSMGNGPAAMVAANMKRSFDIEFGLMVGIAGGVWSKKNDIRLGDIIVGQPAGLHGGVVQWDNRKTLVGGTFERTGSLNRPPSILLHALQTLKECDETDGIDLPGALSFMIKNKPRMAGKYEYQDVESDQLFNASYNHEGEDTCEDCSVASLVQRSPRASSTPQVHYGNIASGNEVMKDGLTRDLIAKQEGVICFGMEAAGLMNDFPCLVIRGICDYADSHKNDVWQPYAAATAAAFARVFLKFVDKQQKIEISSRIKSRQYTILPFTRNPNFVARNDIFEALDELLSSTKTYQTAAIWGLGGCGKSQVALEYAYRYQERTSCSVFWVRGDTLASFSKSYGDIARKAGLPLDLKAEDLLHAVQDWMETQNGWLLILDNVDDLKLFKAPYSDHDDSDESYSQDLLRFIPKVGGIIIWTSRDNAILGQLVNLNWGVEVRGMTDAEALELLRIRSGRYDPNQPSDGEVELLKLLENLPLAIAQAAAYIQQTKVSLEYYIEMFNKSETEQSDLLQFEFSDFHRLDVPNSVMKTWLISMKNIALESQCAKTILYTIAFLDNLSLPYELLEAAAGPTYNKSDVLIAAGRLIAYSFLQAQKGVETGPLVYQEHRLVQLATRRALSTLEVHSFSGKALEVMEKLFPSGTHDTWSSCQVYLSHALKIVAVLKADGYSNKAPALLGRVGRFYCEQGRYVEAELLEVQVLELRKGVVGEKHPDTIRAMASLASTWQQQGRSDDAEQLRIEVLALYKSVVGEKHPDTIRAMANLASTWRQQGQSNKAEQLEVQVLELRKSVVREKHLDTILAMANLASTWWQQGRSDEAERLQVQVLELYKSVVGEKHPDTIRATANLALTWWQQGRSNEAERLQVQVLELYKSVVGEKHPDTIRAMANLASTWWQQGRSDEAEQLQVQVLELYKSVVGEKHPDTIGAMANLTVMRSTHSLF